MSKKITLDDLIRIFGESFIPSELDEKIVMKHFDVGVNRIIGERTVDKIKDVLLSAIEITRMEQFKERGKVLESPLEIYSKQKVPNVSYETPKEKERQKIEHKAEKVDKYGLSSIRSGVVSKIVEEKTLQKTEKRVKKESQPISEQKKEELPTIEDLTILSGGKFSRSTDDESAHDVQKEIAIREYHIQDESRSVRWGVDKVRDKAGNFQEINNPSYIFHSDLWQFEEAREKIASNRCEILQHLVLDMVANNINVVMLEDENEPFFVVEGLGIVKSKDTLKDKIRIDEPIHLVVISSEAWQIALKKPEALIRGNETYGSEVKHSIDMTSVVPLSNIRNAITQLDSKFKVEYLDPENVITKAVKEIENQRKNIIWSCGATTIPILREAVYKHRLAIDKPQNSLNMIIIGTNKAFHPMKLTFFGNGSYQLTELFSDYCKKHSILTKEAITNIFGSIPAVFDSLLDQAPGNEIINVALAISRRLAFSAMDIYFDPGYFKGNLSDIMPISKLDIVLPPKINELQEKLIKKGFILDRFFSIH